MAHSTFYTATQGNRAPYQATGDAQVTADDTASQAVADALVVSTAARARYNGVIVTPATATKAALATQQFTAVVEPGVLGLGVTWSSSDATKATVDANGLATAVATGAARIIATSVENGLVTGYADLTVS